MAHPGKGPGQMGGFSYTQYIAPGLIMMSVITNSYGNVVGGLCRKATRSMIMLVVVVAGIWVIGKFVPGGFIPDEDKGYMFVSVSLPEGASLQRSDEILKQVEEIVCGTKGVRSAFGLAGYNILNSLNFPNSAMMFVGLDDWKERKSPELHARAIAEAWNKKFQAIPGARARPGTAPD